MMIMAAYALFMKMDSKQGYPLRTAVCHVSKKLLHS